METDWHLQSLFSIWGIATREIGYGPGVYCEVVSGPLEAAETPADVERFAWPAAHPRHGREHPDVCEIGYTWLAHDAIRTAANTEAKLLMLTHAFEGWDMLRVCLHTDARNKRSQAAIERIGARFEGVLRAHRMGADFTVRDSWRYSILAAEWPEAKARLAERLQR